MQHHPLGFNPYPEVPSYGGTKLRGVYTHVPGGPPVAGSRDSHLGYSGHSTRNHPSPSHGPSTPNMAGTSSLGYPPEHEMGAMPPGGQQLVANPPYFGHANAGPPPTFPPSSSHGSGLKAVSNGRRSPPLPPHLPNGMPSSKSNGSWLNPGMGMGSFQIGSSDGKGGDRDTRTVHDDDERDRLVTRVRDRKRTERDNMERRDYWDTQHYHFNTDLVYTWSWCRRSSPFILSPPKSPSPRCLSPWTSATSFVIAISCAPGSGGAPPIVHGLRTTTCPLHIIHPPISCSHQVATKPSHRHGRGRGNISWSQRYRDPSLTLYA